MRRLFHDVLWFGARAHWNRPAWEVYDIVKWLFLDERKNGLEYFSWPVSEWENLSGVLAGGWFVYCCGWLE